MKVFNFFFEGEANKVTKKGKKKKKKEKKKQQQQKQKNTALLY